MMTTSTKPQTTPMSTIGEMVETFCELHFADSNSSEPWSAFAKRCPGLAISHREDAKRGLLAVIEKHIGPMLEHAHLEGQTIGARWHAVNEPEAAHFKGRILSALTATGRE